MQDLVVTADVAEVAAFLAAASVHELTTARRWFGKSRGWFTRAREDVFRPGPTPDFSRFSKLVWIESLCAAGLNGPTAAARRIRWTMLGESEPDAGEALLVRVLCDRDRDWASVFVEAASGVSLGDGRGAGSVVLTRVLRAVIARHGLRAPAGSAFYVAWLVPHGGAFRGPDRTEAAEELVGLLRRDPLMPDLLYRFLESGQQGREPALPDALTVLVADGIVDRGRVIDTVLQQLTQTQRLLNCRVLASTLRALQLMAADVPHGFSFVCGVLATAEGSAGPVLLPVALDLLVDEEELGQLAAVVAGRPERKQKDLLLRWLSGKDSLARVGQKGVVASLRTLLDGDGDAQFSARVERTLAALGESATPSVASVRNLWDQEPRPGTLPDLSRWWGSEEPPLPTALELLGTGEHEPSATTQPLARGVHQILSGRMPPEDLVRCARLLKSTGQLSMPRSSELFGELFLAGGLRLTWQAALSIADLASATPARVSGVATLLRVLASYALETPAQEPPANIARLARESSASKARHEALALCARLTRSDSAAFADPAPRGTEAAAEARAAGWWDAAPLSGPAGSLSPRPGRTLDELRGALQDCIAGGSYWVGVRTDLSLLLEPGLMLDELTAAIATYGAVAVSDVARSIVLPAHRLGPFGIALALWANNHLSADSYWDLANAAKAGESRLTEVALELLSRTADPEPFDLGMSVHYHPLHSPDSASLFLLVCETLLLAHRAVPLLSTPTYEDGTVDLAALLDRLGRRTASSVGPLDLLSALYRLRPVDGAGVPRIPCLTTAAEVTSATGTTTEDVAEVITTWLKGGGLPQLQWSRGGMYRPDGAPPSQAQTLWQDWTVDVNPPVPWSWCAAAPLGLPTSIYSSSRPAAVPMFPLWPDLVLPGHRMFQLLPALAGRIGGPSVEGMLLAMANKAQPLRVLASDAWQRLAEQQRLEPDLVADVARHRFAMGDGLAAAVPIWSHALNGPGLRGAWPSALAVADVACALAAPPAGLEDMLELLCDFAGLVPDPVVPAGIRLLSDGTGTTPAHVAARQLVRRLTEEQS